VGKYPNVVAVKRGGKIACYRARLVFPFDAELGYKPKPLDFYGATEREAHTKRANYKPESTPNETTPFVAFLKDEFIPSQEARYKNGELSWTRYSDRKSRLERFIIEPKDKPQLEAARIRKVVLGKLKAQVVEEFFNALEREGVGAITRGKLRNDLRLALKQAKRRIPERVGDYFEDVHVPTLARKPRKLFDAEQILRVINDPAKPANHRALVAFQFVTQCRPSEMFALTWPDVDLKNGLVTFDKAVRRTDDGFKVTPGSKTAQKGVRQVPLGANLRQLLRTLKAVATANGDADGPVFTWQGKRDRRPKPLNKDRMRYAWRDAKESLGLPDGPDFYSLKHLGNSHALRHGVAAETQAKKMGHTTPRMARETYRQIADPELCAAAQVFDVAVGC
jgi:integrase